MPRAWQQEARLRRPPPLGGLADRLLGDAGDLGRPVRRPLVHVLGDRVEADRVVVDERVIEPVVLDHQVQDAVEERGVAARLDRQEQIAGPRDRRDARIDDDDLRPVLAGLPDVVGRDRRALGDVRAADPDHLGAEDVAPGVCGAIDAERLLVARRGADHAEPAVVVDVRRAQTHAGELAHQVGLLGRQAGAGEDRERVASVRASGSDRFPPAVRRIASSYAMRRKPLGRAGIASGRRAAAGRDAPAAGSA